MWIHEMFNTRKPIIAMCHMRALPGDPGYDAAGGMKAIVDNVRMNLKALQDGGVDGIMFSNEASLPYLTKVEAITTASMARVIAEVYDDISVPFGVNVLWDPIASIDLAVATGARFVREIFTGVYASDYGTWDTNAGATIRHQHAVGGQDVKLLFNIVPESAVYMADRDVADIARSTVFVAGPDALCVSGITAGAETSATTLKRVKDAVPETVVFANTGVRVDNIEEQLAIADGAVVGTTFKKDGYIWNDVDVDRVRAFMDKAKAVRG
jgi:membrane complex biogenesis BtpA family protein